MWFLIGNYMVCCFFVVDCIIVEGIFIGFFYFFMIQNVIEIIIWCCFQLLVKLRVLNQECKFYVVFFLEILDRKVIFRVMSLGIIILVQIIFQVFVDYVFGIYRCLD